MVLSKRCIEITDHAHHRGSHRLRIPKAQRTARIREALREGTWYENPSSPDEFLVLHRHANKPFCVVAKVDRRTVTVTTLYLLRNTAKIRAYQQHSPPLSASDIVDRYGLST